MIIREMHEVVPFLISCHICTASVVTKVNLLILNSYLQLCALKFSKLCQLILMLAKFSNAYTPIMLKIMPAYLPTLLFPSPSSSEP